MGKKQKKKASGAEKTAVKTDKKASKKAKKDALAVGEEDITAIVSKLDEEENKKQLPVKLNACSFFSPRVNFSLSAHPKNKELYVFGGEFFNGDKVYVYNDFYVYKTSDNSWHQFSGGALPTPRCSHQACLLKMTKYFLFVFGGEYASPTQSQFYHYSDLWRFDVKQYSWKKLNTPGVCPRGRSGHRMIALRTNLYVFGGFHDNGNTCRYFNDLWTFDCHETEQWTEIKASTPPSPRSGCLFLPLPDNKGICVLGGYFKKKDKKSESGITLTDSYTLMLNSAEKPVWQPVKFSGTRPSTRCSMTAAVNPDNGKAYVFGGVFDIDEDENLNSVFFNDLYQIDLDKQRWSLVNYESSGQKGDQQSVCQKLSFLSFALSANSDVLMEGAAGGDSKDVPVASCSTTDVSMEVSANIPSERINCGMAIMNDCLYLLGGIVEDDETDRSRTLDDFYGLQLKKPSNWATLHKSTSHDQDWVSSDSNSDSDMASEHSDDDEDPPVIRPEENFESYFTRTRDYWEQFSLSETEGADRGDALKLARRFAKEFCSRHSKGTT